MKKRELLVQLRQETQVRRKLLEAVLSGKVKIFQKGNVTYFRPLAGRALRVDLDKVVALAIVKGYGRNDHV